MTSRKIIVIGSSNMDMVIKADHIPAPGETVLSGAFFMNPGGKGANQAVAVARLGGDVAFISKLGNDLFGKQFLQLFNEEGIDTSFMLSSPDLPSGVALITVDRSGENSIVVASGANADLQFGDIEPAWSLIAEASILLLQLEIPMETVEAVAAFAAERAVKVVLNPAPSQHLSAELLRNIDILTPNKTEASMLSSIAVIDLETASLAAKAICRKGVETVVVTMGSLGSVICQGENCVTVDAQKVVAVDSTAAGDVFNGALAVALSEGNDLEPAVRFASAAAAISVTRLGAQSSIPYRNEFNMLSADSR